MENIKKKNVNFWTINVPGIDNEVKRDMAGTLDFYKKVDEVRYRQEPYLNDFFAKFFKPGLVSLEIGCGLGTDLRTFSRNGVKAVGLDYSPENAYLSQLGFRVSDLEGKVVAADAECLPFPNESFHLVYSWGCLHHCPDTKKTIDEIQRVTKPGGKIMVMLYHKGYQFWYILACYILGLRWLKNSLKDYISYKYDSTPLSQLFSKRQIRKLFKNFEETKIEIINFGGIQNHSILKCVWKIFELFPFLRKIFGSFAVITARKSGKHSSASDMPKPCCPLCHSVLEYQENTIICTKPSCASKFSIYKREIPMLHPKSIKKFVANSDSID